MDVEVDEKGLTLADGEDRALDVLFDGRRIFSFWSGRDTRAAGIGRRRFLWPSALHRFLDGRTELQLVDHLTGHEEFRAVVRLGSSAEPIRVQDPQGNPLGLDKSMRLTRLFESRSEEHLAPLLDAVGTALAALEDAGVRPFLAYGTLLGAVREGHLIGHDSDADLAYVSRHDHPVDVIRESFELQRALRRQGFPISRYSGLAFKIIVKESDGSPRGLDVFGGFVRDGVLYLMGEVGAPFELSWIEPRSRVTLEGRDFPAPAVPARLLEAMYGPTWQVPDPAYKFETPQSTQRRLTGWFRGTRVGLDSKWSRVRAGTAAAQRTNVSGFARWVRAQEPDAACVVDIGCGDGRDTLWFARQGVEAWGLDYFPRSFRRAARRAAAQDMSASFDWMNLCELRSVLVTGALLARRPGPRVAMARHVLDASDPTGRDSLLRLARMVTGGAGRLYLQTQSVATPESRALGVRPIPPAAVEELVVSRGGRVVARHDMDESMDASGGSGPGDGPGSSTLSRWVIAWNR